MKKLAIGLVAIAVLAAAYFGFGQGLLTPAASSAAEKTPTVPAVKADAKVVAEAKVVPVQTAALNLASGGVVAAVLVAEGDRVEAGQTLVRLESNRQVVAVSQAEAGLRKAEAGLAQAKAGARTQEIDAAKAAYDAAQAQLARLQQPARPEEIAGAAAEVAAAKAGLAQAQEGPSKDQVVAAQNDLAKLKAGATAEDTKAAELAVEQAKAALWSAQSERDGVCGSGYAPKFQCDSANSRVMAAETAVANAQNSLIRVKAGSRAEDIATAEARLSKLNEGPSAAGIASARARIDQAQARLDALKAPARPADLAAAQAEVRRAQAQLDLIQAGARPEVVAVAEADVAAAKAALDQARAALAETELRAPFPGTVAALAVKAGELAAPSTPVVQLADTSAWQIETTDLTELNAVKIRDGMVVTIAFDAIPGLELPGTVTRVKTIGEKKQGDVTYTALVKPERQDERLRWNMTATVTMAQ